MRFRLNLLVWLIIGSGNLLAVEGNSSVLAAEQRVGSTITMPENIVAVISEQWKAATSEKEKAIWGYILQSPLGVAALNQLAIEGFISPTCDKTFYTHNEYNSFQFLLQIQCPTKRGVNTALSYDEMQVTFKRFEDTIIDFIVERIYEDEGGFPGTVSAAVIQAAAQQFKTDSATLSIVSSERQIWPDGCLGLGGPSEGCSMALVEGWRVKASDGKRTWTFRTNDDGSQVRLESQ